MNNYHLKRLVIEHEEEFEFDGEYGNYQSCNLRGQPFGEEKSSSPYRVYQNLSKSAIQQLHRIVVTESSADVIFDAENVSIQRTPIISTFSR